MQCLSRLLETKVKRFSNKNFIIFENQKITYKEFDIKTSKLANYFKSKGINKGDVVGLYLPSTPELAIGYWACQKIGAIAIPMSVMFRLKEVKNITSRTSMKLIITTPENYEITREISSERDSELKEILVIGEHGLTEVASFDEVLKNESSEIEFSNCEIDDVAAVFFTSGTTGEPKGAMQTHKSIYSTLKDMEVFWKFEYGKEKLLGVLPIFNNFGATLNMNGAIFNGGTLLLIERWDSEKVLKVISEEKATFFAGTPTMFLYLLEEYKKSYYDLSSLKLCITGGAIVSPEIIERVENELNVKLIEIYGATETSGAITGDPVIGKRKKGSAGIPFGSSTIKIVDDNANEVPAGTIGEIVVHGDPVGKGYWGDEETTAKTFREDGWFSGDLGYVDEDGYLYIIDRKKDVIISGGNNIFAIEVENILYTIPGVAMAAVVGVPDELKGEIPKAYIVQKGSIELNKEEIIAYCRENLSAYKVPRIVEFIEEMPLGPSGKILKRKLREMVSK